MTGSANRFAWPVFKVTSLSATWVQQFSVDFLNSFRWIWIWIFQSRKLWNFPKSGWSVGVVICRWHNYFVGSCRWLENKYFVAGKWWSHSLVLVQVNKLWFCITTFFSHILTRKSCVCISMDATTYQLVPMVELLWAQTTVDRCVFGANRKPSSGTHLPIIAKRVSRFSLAVRFLYVG